MPSSTVSVSPGAPRAEEIARAYGPLVSSICRRMLRDPEAARDAAQEAWVEILKSLPSFRGEAKLSTWIFTIARRHLSRHARRDQVYSTRFLRDYFHGDALPAPEERESRQAWVREMCDKCLTGILHCLDWESRLAYVFREIAGLGYGEIAEVLDCRPEAARQLTSRAKRRLRHFLRDECGLYDAQAPCRCRMRRWVEEVDLPAEYARLRRTVNRVRLYRESEQVLPKKNYWEALEFPA